MSDPTVFTLVSKTGTSTGAGSAIATGGALGCLVHVVAATTSTSSVLIQGALTTAGPWRTLATITNVDAEPSGTAYTGNAWPFIRANVASHSGGGTITATMTTLDYAPGYWNLVTRAVDAAGALTVTNLTDSGLTATRVPYAGTAGLLVDAATFTFTTSGGILDVTAIRPSGLTATRVPFAGAAGLIGDSAAFTHVAGLTASTIFQGGAKDTMTVCNASEAVAVAPKTVIITGSTRVMTLAAPTVTDHDGYTITFKSRHASAHTITTGSGAFNSNKNVATFGGAVSDFLIVRAYQGVWDVIGSSGITLSGS